METTLKLIQMLYIAIFQNYSNIQLRVKCITQRYKSSEKEKLFKFQDTSFELSPHALPQKSGAIVVVLWYKTMHSFLVQSFKETLQYCDEWRKFTSVSQSDSQSVCQ